MTTPSNFYKNSAYAYAREFDLSSVLDNLHAYRLATGSGSVPGDEKPGGLQQGPTEGGVTSNEGHGRLEKKRHHPYLRSQNRSQPTKMGGVGSDVMQVNEVAKLKLESLGYQPSMSDDNSQPRGNASSVLGFDPYERGFDPRKNPQAGYVETRDKNVLTSLLGFDATEDSSSDDDKDSDLSASLSVTPSMTLPDLKASNEVVVLQRSGQRFAAPGEPECVVCGRYGAYICNETEDDVCSLECKQDVLHLQAVPCPKESTEVDTSFVAPYRPSGALQLPEADPEEWDYKNHRWTYRHSSLSTFRCWKCKRPGHLPEDCVVSMDIPAQLPSDPTRYHVPTKQNRGATLQAIYDRCKEIKKKAKISVCDKCGTSFNLACCLHCGKIFCDSQGHLTSHLRENPSHRQIFSFKLHRLVKCCKGPCPVVDMDDLLACNTCMSKAFDKYYSMYNATWKGAGLKLIVNAVCCDAHFNWHRMNCANADIEDAAFLLRENGSVLLGSQISEFLF